MGENQNAISSLRGIVDECLQRGGELGGVEKNWAENDAREIDRRSVTRAKNNWLLTHQLTSGVTGGSLLFRNTETGGQWWSTRYTEIDTTIPWEKEMNEL